MAFGFLASPITQKGRALIPRVLPEEGDPAVGALEPVLATRLPSHSVSVREPGGAA